MGSLSFRNQKRHEREAVYKKTGTRDNNISSVIPGANYIDNSERRKDYKI